MIQVQTFLFYPFWDIQISRQQNGNFWTAESWVSATHEGNEGVGIFKENTGEKVRFLLNKCVWISGYNHIIWLYSFLLRIKYQKALTCEATKQKKCFTTFASKKILGGQPTNPWGCETIDTGSGSASYFCYSKSSLFWPPQKTWWKSMDGWKDREVDVWQVHQEKKTIERRVCSLLKPDDAYTVEILWGNWVDVDSKSICMFPKPTVS